MRRRNRTGSHEERPILLLAAAVALSVAASVAALAAAPGVAAASPAPATGRPGAAVGTSGIAAGDVPAGGSVAAAGNGSPADPNIVYVGRWDTGSAALAVPNWTGAYLQTSFTGTTVRISQRNAVNMYVSIDGGADVFFAGVRGTVNLTPQPLRAGTHRLRVSYRSGDTVFQGLLFDPGAGTVGTAVSPKLVEFVGDSITAGFSDSKLALSAYGWLLGERLGVRHTQIARSGYCLVGQSGCVGQATQFFQLASTGTTAWDFSRYQASAVVINLGTNDIGHGVTGPQFQAAYTTFLREVRGRYPNAVLFAMETFKRRYLAETRAAVTARNNAGDANVRFIGTEGWLTVGADYTDTDGHPNDAGHLKVANRLAPIIAPAIGVPVPTVAPVPTAARVPAAAPAATGDGSPTDPNVKFAGRWDTTSATGYVPKWAGAYVKVGFTGTTVRLRQRGTIDFWASIDGGADVAFTNVAGTVSLTPTPLRSGNHTLRVSYRPVAGSYHGDAVYQGLVLDAGAHTFAPAVSATLIEFVGDSITVGQLSSKQALTAYGWLVGERLHAEHTQIAQGGACLVATPDGCVGLSTQFLRTGSTADSPDWDFSRYQARAVVINLGTNDGGHGVHTPQFQATYVTLLERVRAKYPNAAIFAMGIFRARFVDQTRNAVAIRNNAGDPNVFFVDTTGWIDPATDTVDNVHPNDSGHRKIADRLAPVIAARIGR